MKQTSTPKALVVEDTATNSMIVSRLLDDRGFAVTTAFNGAEGLHEFLRFPYYDIVVLDLMMPEVDGFTFLSVIESLYNRRKLSRNPYIMVETSAGKYADVDAISKYNCVYQVKPKPIIVPDFEESIQEIMKRRQEDRKGLSV